MMYRTGYVHTEKRRKNIKSCEDSSPGLKILGRFRMELLSNITNFDGHLCLYAPTFNCKEHVGKKLIYQIHLE